jgi:hypothetical protein
MSSFRHGAHLQCVPHSRFAAASFRIGAIISSDTCARCALGAACDFRRRYPRNSRRCRRRGVGLHERRCLPPGPDAAGQEHQERAPGGGAARALDAAPQDEALVAQRRVLGDQRRLAAAPIRQRPGD